MWSEVETAFSYFEPGAIQQHPPATELMINHAEQLLGVQFPPSMRQFLQISNGFSGCDKQVLRLPAIDAEPNDDIVDWSLSYRDAGETNDLQSIIVIVQDGTGDPYCVWADKVDERGECPIIKVDHETCEIMTIVASSYERFLWFFLTDLQRCFKPNGKFKDWEEIDDEEYDWYEDLDFLLQHDPDLAKWRST